MDILTEKQNFDIGTSALLFKVYDAVMRDVYRDAVLAAQLTIETQVSFAEILIAAAIAGERDFDILKRLALQTLPQGPIKLGLLPLAEVV